MTECECGHANVILGFHLELSSPLVPPEEEAPRIMAIVRHLPVAPLAHGKVEAALVCTLAGLRERRSNWAFEKSIYVCGGLGHMDDLLLTVTHQGVSCGLGGPVTCEANAWQSDVADNLLSKHLIDRVEFGLNGRQLVLYWRKPGRKNTPPLLTHGMRSTEP